MNIPRWSLVLALFAACHRDAPTTPSTSAARDAGRLPCHCAHDAAAMTPLAPAADTSLFLLDTPWTDQAGRTFRFASLRGSPTMVLLFYGTCQSVCPVLINDLMRLDAALTPAARARTRFVLVTLDPETDTVERLRALSVERHFDPSRWTLLRGSDDEVRTLATVLGVQYSRVSPEMITHSNTLTLLDPQGVVSQQLEGLRQPVEGLARAVEGFTR